MGQLHGIVILQVGQLDYRWDSYIKVGIVILEVGQLH